MAPFSALIVLAACASMQPKPKAAPDMVGCRASGSTIRLKGEDTDRDINICFYVDGSMTWKLGDFKAVAPTPPPPAPKANGKK